MPIPQYLLSLFNSKTVTCKFCVFLIIINIYIHFWKIDLETRSEEERREGENMKEELLIYF